MLSDKKSIALIVIIFLILTIAFTANVLYIRTAGELAEIWKAQPKIQTQEPSWATPSSKALKRAYTLIASREKIVSGYALDDERSALLISEKPKSGQYSAHALWFFYRGGGALIEGGWHIKTIKTFYHCEEVALEKNGTTVILNHKNAGCPQPITNHRYVYSQDGELLLIVDEEPEESKAMLRLYDNDREYKISVELTFKSNCRDLALSNVDAKYFYVEMLGIHVAGDFHSFAPTKVMCPPNYYKDSYLQDVGYPPMNPFFSFEAYDSEYSVVQLRLPDRRLVLIDMRKQKVVTSKEKFSHDPDCRPVDMTQRCPLLRKTPRRTETLITDIWSDPVLLQHLLKSPYKGRGFSLQEEFQRTKRGYPVFKLIGHFPGFGEQGRFEFDLQSRRFQKLEE